MPPRGVGDLGAVGRVVEEHAGPRPGQADEVDVEVVEAGDDRRAPSVDDPRPGRRLEHLVERRRRSRPGPPRSRPPPTVSMPPGSAATTRPAGDDEVGALALIGPARR